MYLSEFTSSLTGIGDKSMLCLGMHLARRELRIALQEFHRRVHLLSPACRRQGSTPAREDILAATQRGTF